METTIQVFIKISNWNRDASRWHFPGRLARISGMASECPLGRRNQPLAGQSLFPVLSDFCNVRARRDLEESLSAWVFHQCDDLEVSVAFTDHHRINTTAPDEAAALRLDELLHLFAIEPVGRFARHAFVCVCCVCLVYRSCFD